MAMLRLKCSQIREEVPHNCYVVFEAMAIVAVDSYRERRWALWEDTWNSGGCHTTLLLGSEGGTYRTYIPDLLAPSMEIDPDIARTAAEIERKMSGSSPECQEFRV